MSVYRAALSFPMDSSLPKDVININPHFNGTDPDALAGALKANLDAYTATAGKPYTIKIYDAAKAPPSYPLATRTVTGTPPASPAPREVAICLSYFAIYNRPSFRGRLYLPSSWVTASPQVRPSDPLLANVLAFATSVLTKSLPPSTFWTVWSKLHHTDAQVTDIWCDDEWDTVRSRGMKSTKRVTAKV